MERKIEKFKGDLIVKLPKKYVEALGLDSGDEVFISLDQANNRMVISPIGSQVTDVGIDETFANQVADFIERYKPALEQLARE